MQIRFHSITQMGSRDSNQDCTGAQLLASHGCFVVCDGVAGIPGGQRAATLARDTLLAQVTRQTALVPQHTPAMIAAVEQAISEAQHAEPEFSQMSTTLAALFIDRQQLRAWWCHAGDSRIYHFRRGVMHHVSQDHSLIQQFREAGYENTGINSHLLYNALGTGNHDRHHYSPVLTLEDGDAFLLCSDGFWHNLTAARMEQALRMVRSPQEWLTLMLKTLDQPEKQDNLSAIAVWCGSPQDATLLFSQADAARFLPPRD